ncbi:hypothetical protein H0H87_002363, partial [Tephrocybe sp. NHM501043]
NDEFITFENPFSDVSAPVKLSRTPSLALHPFARRLSTPGRPRAAVCTPRHFSPAHTPLRQHAIILRHGSLSDDNDSYFPHSHVPSGKVRFREEEDRIAEADEEEEEKEKEVEKVDDANFSRPDLVSRIVSTVSSLATTRPRHLKGLKLKRVAKKVAGLFHHTHTRR